MLTVATSHNHRANYTLGCNGWKYTPRENRSRLSVPIVPWPNAVGLVSAKCQEQYHCYLSATAPLSTFTSRKEPTFMLNRNTFIGPWAGVPTAWKEDGTFDEMTYRRDVRACCNAGAPGVYTHGTTGEFYAMELDEWQAVCVAAVKECHAAGTPIALGVTSTYTLGAVRRARIAAELGADAIQVALPFWLPVGDEQVLPFFEEVAQAAPGLAISIYDTMRSKKALTLEQHRQIHEIAPGYMMVKSMAGTLGCSEQGCAALSEFTNVFVDENMWSRLGPHGAIGCASANFYINPKYFLSMFDALQSQDWERLAPMCAKLEKMSLEAIQNLLPDTYHDTAYDRLKGHLAGFLQTSLSNRGPYPSTSQQDIETVRNWCRREFPELLEL